MNLDVNPYVADPDWGMLIVVYFFLGGIAAGAYAVAAMAELFGDGDDQRGLHAAYLLAFPLIGVCGLLLIADLGRPERFWHMMIKSNTGWPMLKWWSPMSAGSWGLSAFGFFAFVSFVQVIAENPRFPWPALGQLSGRLRGGLIGSLFAGGGLFSALFLGSYTGALLGATNQPIWSNTTWTGALFLTSALSTGIAAVVLVDRWTRLGVDEDVIHRLERLDTWAALLELTLLAIFLGSLGRLAVTGVQRWPGILIPTFVIPIGLLAPLALKRFGMTRVPGLDSVLVLLGGFVLRAAVIGMPLSFLVRHHH